MATIGTHADDIIRNYASAAGSGLIRVLNEAVDDLELSDPATIRRIANALSAAFIEGIRVGESEVLAQAVEQGVDVSVRRVGQETDAA